MTDAYCPLCSPTRADVILWQDAQCRVVDVGDSDYPGYCRVVWNAHIREMSNLPPAARAHLMAVVYAVEQALIEVLRPDKINLASLGNQVPHLHWHVIPRFVDDAHFPDAIWAVRRRDERPRPLNTSTLRRELLRRLEPDGSPQ